MTPDTRQGLTRAAWNERPFGPGRIDFLDWMQSIPPGQRANTMTHAIGFLVSLAAGAWLVVAGFAHGSVVFAMSVAVFVGTLVAMYAASAIYHGTSIGARRPRYRVLDHCAIYLLIAGTYTPFAVALGGAWGTLLLIIVWPVAAMGVALKLFSPMRHPWISTSLYIAMGWAIVLAAGPFLEHFTRATLGWIVAGGIAYTAGIPFYLMSSRPRLHTLWHCFVILGSGFHFIAVASLIQSSGTLAP